MTLHNVIMCAEGYSSWFVCLSVNAYSGTALCTLETQEVTIKSVYQLPHGIY